MTALAQFDHAFARLPLVAILRGVRPHEVVAIGEALVEAGFSLIEVPMNSPEPLRSVAALKQALGDRAVLGAGTVLDPADVARVEQAGGTLIISPNMNPAVIGAAASRGLVALPGIATPTEAFAALAAGAAALKLFPAEAASPAVLKAMRAVLPKDARMLPVGGIAPDTMAPWHAAGAAGYGLGSALYRPGLDASAVGANARRFVGAYRAL
jgi:2-dehydro-3-deoxyphosphogalactonate aldolase